MSDVSSVSRAYSDSVLPKCLRRSRASLCKYTERGLRHLSATQHVSTMREKMDRVETMISNMIESETSTEAEVGTGGDPDGVPALGVSRQTEQTSTAPIGELRLSTSGSTQWVAAAHWESMLEDVLCHPFLILLHIFITDDYQDRRCQFAPRLLGDGERPAANAQRITWYLLNWQHSTHRPLLSCFDELIAQRSDRLLASSLEPRSSPVCVVQCFRSCQG